MKRFNKIALVSLLMLPGMVQSAGLGSWLKKTFVGDVVYEIPGEDDQFIKKLCELKGILSNNVTLSVYSMCREEMSKKLFNQMQPRSYEHQLQVQKLQSPESIYTLESSIGTSFTLKTTFNQAPDTWYIFRAFNAYPTKHSLMLNNNSLWEVQNSLITACVEKIKGTRILPKIPCGFTASVLALAVGAGTFKVMSYAFPKCNIVDKTYWPCAATAVVGYLGYAYLETYSDSKLSGEGKLKHIVSKSLALDSR